MAETQNTTRIVNTHCQLTANGGGVAIMPSYGGARTSHVNGWLIYRVGARGKQIPTDPDAHWSQYGRKWFSNRNHKGTFHQRQAAALEDAKRWIAEQGWYDGEWKRNRQRDYVPAEINKRFPIPKREAK